MIDRERRESLSFVVLFRLVVGKDAQFCYSMRYTFGSFSGASEVGSSRSKLRDLCLTIRAECREETHL